MNNKITNKFFFVTKFDHLVVEECWAKILNLRSIFYINELTVRTPLKLVTSISAPVSFSENFSSNDLTNGMLTNIWKYLFNAKLVNARPSFLVTALKKKKSSFDFNS